MFRRFVSVCVVLVLIATVGRAIERRNAGTRVLGVQLTPDGLQGVFPEQPDRGIFYGGLIRAQDAACIGGFLTVLTRLCTHGPDGGPPGTQSGTTTTSTPAPTRPPATGTSTDPDPAAASGVCGTDGNRIQAVFARPPGTPDAFADSLPSFRRWASEVDEQFNASAAETGGTRHVPYVTDANCELAVDSIVLSDTGADTFDNTIHDLQAQGYDRPDRKYLVWVDANVYWGIGTMWMDDSPEESNLNNRGPSYSRIDRRCWGFCEGHEVMHNMGAVQKTAPHATAGHCTDEHDEMCYEDAPGVQMTVICDDAARGRLFDCNHDDYFDVAPAEGSYLDTHWNAARNRFLLTG